MRMIIAALLCAVATTALARNTGQIAADDPNREWFKRQQIKACCSEADGKFVDFRLVEYGTGFEIKIDGEWVLVPPHAIDAVKGEKNPYLEALAWYRVDNHYNDEGQITSKGWYIRCFIPGVGG